MPKLKDGGSFFISVLIADLVFLQALWKIVTLSTVASLEQGFRCELLPGLLDTSR